MRLGDLDALFLQLWRKADPFKEQPSVKPSAVWSEAATLAREAPTIDPETIPLVRQLREELERVKKERDAVAKDVKRIVRRWDNGEELVQVCADFCANNNGVCVRHAELGRFDECKGFAYRGPQKEE
ncbi:hypothetical protein [Candidatus Allofournierella merdipullorum]|uniref:hypothetical protein n=1 Tax=Candidatus Allofournierella merdipullorum TaxID=2838595 RepID=UPI00374E6FD9